MEQLFGPYAAYIIPAYAVSLAVILAMIVVTRVQYRRQLNEIEALEKQGVARRAGQKREPGGKSSHESSGKSSGKTGNGSSK